MQDIELNEKHYAAIIHDSVRHEGDQRSRDFPGHGYPEWTEQVMKYKPFKDKEEMQKWVESQEKGSSYGKKKYQIIEANPLVVSVEVKIGIVPATR